MPKLKILQFLICNFPENSQKLDVVRVLQAISADVIRITIKLSIIPGTLAMQRLAGLV